MISVAPNIAHSPTHPRIPAAMSVSSISPKQRRVEAEAAGPVAAAVGVDDREDVVSLQDPAELIVHANHEAIMYAVTQCEDCRAHAAGTGLVRCRQFFASDIAHTTPTRSLEERIRTVSKRIHLGNANMQYFEDLAFEALHDVRAYLPRRWPETRKMREMQEAADTGRALMQKAWEEHMTKVLAARQAVAELNDALVRVHTMMWYSPRDEEYLCVFMPTPDVIQSCKDLVKDVLARTACFAEATYFVRPAMFAVFEGEHLIVNLA